MGNSSTNAHERRLQCTLEVSTVAMRISLRKQTEDDTSVRYEFTTEDGPVRFLVFDKANETILPEDGIKDGVFRGAAGKLAGVLLETGQAPERLTYSA